MDGGTPQDPGPRGLRGERDDGTRHRDPRRRRPRDGRDRPGDGRQVQVRLGNRHRDGVRPQGPLRRHRAPDLRQERRARVDDRLAAEGVRALAS